MTKGNKGQIFHARWQYSAPVMSVEARMQSSSKGLSAAGKQAPASNCPFTHLTCSARHRWPKMPESWNLGGQASSLQLPFCKQPWQRINSFHHLALRSQRKTWLAPHWVAAPRAWQPKEELPTLLGLMATRGLSSSLASQELQKPAWQSFQRQVLWPESLTTRQASRRSKQAESKEQLQECY